MIGSVGVAAAYRNQIVDILPDGLPAQVAAAASDSIGGRADCCRAELPGAFGESL